MFDLLDVELVVLGIAGAILVAGCMVETISPLTVRLIGFIVDSFYLSTHTGAAGRNH